ncbi:MAG: type VI secretion system tube protein Hcp [Pelomonas sp.]|nr:type VI secretion system tube protein Hcp [Roseateles sp.]
MTAFTRLYMHLEVAGTGAPIAGEAADIDFMRKIVLSSVNWTIKRADEKTRTAARSLARAEPEVLEISKPMDKASTQMLTQLNAGNKLKAIVSLASATESSFLLTITLTNARIIEYKLSVKDGEKGGEVEEDWTLNYDSIAFAYKTEAPPGGTAKTLSSSHQRHPTASTEKSASGADKVLSAYSELGSLEEKKLAADKLKSAFTRDRL